MQEFIFPINTKVSKEQRERLMGQCAQLIWFTGLSGSGKSTLAIQLEARLHEQGYKTYLLDGDNIRAGINQDLRFRRRACVENIRRIGDSRKLMLDAGLDWCYQLSFHLCGRIVNRLKKSRAPKIT